MCVELESCQVCKTCPTAIHTQCYRKSSAQLATDAAVRALGRPVCAHVWYEGLCKCALMINIVNINNHICILRYVLHLTVHIDIYTFSIALQINVYCTFIPTNETILGLLFQGLSC